MMELPKFIACGDLSEFDSDTSYPLDVNFFDSLNWKLLIYKIMILVGWEAIFVPRTSPKSDQTSLPTVFGNAEKNKEARSRQDREPLKNTMFCNSN